MKGPCVWAERCVRGKGNRGVGSRYIRKNTRLSRHVTKGTIERCKRQLGSVLNRN